MLYEKSHDIRVVAAGIKHVVNEDIQIGFTAPRATLE